MKLWLLRPVEGDHHWEPWYSKAFGFVVRAETEEDARKIADRNGGNETSTEYSEDQSRHPWLDAEHSTCNELTQDGSEGMIIEDFASA